MGSRRDTPGKTPSEARDPIQLLIATNPNPRSNAVSFVPALAERKHWLDLDLDLDQALIPILDGAATSAHWGYLLAAASIWVLLPLAAGVARVLRAEVK